MSGRKFSDFLLEFPMYKTVFAAAKATAYRHKVLLTGTYGYGYDLYEDIDVVVSCDDPDKLISNITNVERFSELFQLELNGNCGYGALFVSFKVKSVGKPAVNFIAVQAFDFAKWRYATRVMSKLAVVRHKPHRANVFGALQALYCACEAAELRAPEIVLVKHYPAVAIKSRIVSVSATERKPQAIVIRGARGQKLDCTCCEGHGYVVGPSGSHDCDCIRE